MEGGLDAESFAGPEGAFPRSSSARTQAVVNAVRRILDDPTLAHLMDRKLRFLGECVLQDPRDSSLAQWFFARTRDLRRRAARSYDPFLVNCPRPGTLPAAAGIPLVKLPTSEWLTITPEQLTTGLAVTGPPGSGKTSFFFAMLAALLTAFPEVVAVLIDRKKVFRALAALLPSIPVTVFSVIDELAFSLCHHDSPHVPREQVRSADVELLGSTGGSITSHRPLLSLVEKWGAPDQGFSIRMMEELVATTGGRGVWRAGGVRDRILQMLSFQRVHLGRAFAYTKSTFLSTLFTTPGAYVLEVGMLPPALAAELAIYVMQHAYLDRLYAPQGGKPPLVVFVLDDFTTTLLRSSTTYGGGAPLANMMELQRQLRFSTWVGCHNISLTGARFLQNIENKVICCGRGEDPGLTMRLFGMSPEQFDYVRTMRPGEAIVFAPALLSKPVKGSFPKVEFLQVSDEYCRETAKKFRALVSTEGDAPALAAIIARSQPVTAPPAGSPAPSNQETETVRILRQFAECSWFTLKEHCKRLGISHARGTRLVKCHEEAGYVIKHPVSSCRKDGVLLEVFGDGAALLARHGHVPGARKLTRGGHLHNVAAIALGILSRRDGRQIRYEQDYTTVRIDAVLTGASGDRTLVQIAFSDAKREAEVLAGALALPDVQRSKIMVVARDAKFAEAFRVHLHARVPEADCGMVSVTLFAALLREARAYGGEDGAGGDAQA